MTVLVTGGAGFLGSYVTELLVARGDRPRVVIRPSSVIERTNVRGLETLLRAATVAGVRRIVHVQPLESRGGAPRPAVSPLGAAGDGGGVTRTS